MKKTQEMRISAMMHSTGNPSLVLMGAFGLGLLLACATSAQADTVAYWRFETGPLNTAVPASSIGGDPSYDNTVPDSSGNGNHLRTYTSSTAPTYITSGSAVVPGTGAANAMALNFVRSAPNDDLYAFNKPINGYDFKSWTVEASVRVDIDNAYQVIVGKDGNYTNNPPFALKFNDAVNKFEVLVVDGAGTFHSLLSSFQPTLGQWYNVAATADGSTLRLYAKKLSDVNYVLQASQPISFDGLINSTGPWTVGRGMYASTVTDWLDGAVDEVRISDVALAPSQFLYAAAVPEPQAWTLLLAGLGLFFSLPAGHRRRSFPLPE